MLAFTEHAHPLAVQPMMQNPEVMVFIKDAVRVDNATATTSPFSCLDDDMMGRGLAQQYTNVLIPPDCGAQLLSNKSGTHLATTGRQWILLHNIIWLLHAFRAVPVATKTG